jgi:xanthine dehydrogenase accessory factor
MLTVETPGNEFASANSESEMSGPSKKKSRRPHADNFDWPLWGLTDDIRSALKRALDDGPAALVTLTQLEGGGPRPVGSQMIVGARCVEGFLSGGCIEADVILHARACLEKNEPKRLVYGRGSPWLDIQLLCGARIELLVEVIQPDDPAIAKLFELTDERRTAIWMSDGIHRDCMPAGSEEFPDASMFVRCFNPIPRLVIAGHDPVALALAGLSTQAGFDTHVFWSQGPTAPPPIPGSHYIRDRAASFLSRKFLDQWTFVAACNHDLDKDVDVLQAALKTDAAYVGVLGSRRRLPELKQRLSILGIASSDMSRLRAPIGLALGAKSPFEIAIEIMGEIIKVKSSCGARHSYNEQ